MIVTYRYGQKEQEINVGWWQSSLWQMIIMINIIVNQDRCTQRGFV
jgi:hypothetical protein